MQKVNVCLQSDKYAVKLDEDCFIPNHVWDYIIENIDVLDDEDNFVLTPMLSNGIPHTDRFVESFIKDADALVSNDTINTFGFADTRDFDSGMDFISLDNAEYLCASFCPSFGS